MTVTGSAAGGPPEAVRVRSRKSRAMQVLRRSYREIFVVLAAVLAFFGVYLSANRGPFDGIAYDLTAAAVSHLSAEADRTYGPVAVIAMDQKSLDAPELKDQPRVLMGDGYADVIDATLEAGATAIGFDLIFSYVTQDFSKYFLKFRDTLDARGEQVVLGDTARIKVNLFFLAWLPEEGSVGNLEYAPDDDGVFRHIPSTREVITDQGPAYEPTISSVLLSKAGRTMPPVVLVRPRQHLEAIPTYSMIDVIRCSQRDPARLRQALQGRIVLVGTNLPDEDRKRSPSRFMADPPEVPEVADDGTCQLQPLGASSPGSPTVPGVHLHAAAIEAVLTDRVTTMVSPLFAAVGAAVLAALIAFLSLKFNPLTATASLLALSGGLAATILLLLAREVWLAPGATMVAMILSIVLAYVSRYVIEERRRRRIQNAFGHFVPAVLVNQLSESETPELDGVIRDVSVMFADLSGFTSASEFMSPPELVALGNRYLGMIAGAVDQTHGNVDKFIGDAVMAMWGAPLVDKEHAANAVECAIRARGLVADARHASEARGEIGFRVKIGINSGPAMVGLVGAENRKNYTCIGDTVNTAARLEGLPGDYGCTIVIGESTRRDIGNRFLVCELDSIIVKGRQTPVAVYHVLGRFAMLGAGAERYVELYRAALKAYRRGEFALAQATWLQAAECRWEGTEVEPAIRMAARAADYLANPPEAGWDGVYVRRTK
ncbi:CHASE2 domain-containing protein [Zavarzinia sp. CC-PAN008]|uniref:CHASE2 domain-containing protein n=1 Tax=Zavarzinia sp. CC-PAN008 TaxID=3243332 RepID=UPI003F74600B